jgi:carboxyl-terminal processing protease
MRTYLLFSLLFSSLVLAQTPRPAPAIVTPTAAPTNTTQLPIEEIRRYIQVLNLIEQSYVDPINDSDLFDASLRGLLLELDPHSAYLDASEMQQIREFSSGSYEGIGIEVEFRKDKKLAIVAAIDGTPAAKAGLRAGDVIMAIDGKPVKGANANSASIGLRGKPNSVVRLSIARAGESGTKDIAVMREMIKVESVRARLLEPGYGYVRLSTFQEDTGRRLLQEVSAMQKPGTPKLKGLVLDLRSNPGGLVEAALQVADAFLESGIIVSTRGRMSDASLLLRATAGDILKGAPIIVLVDVGSASASEVVAGALRDNKRALLMGSRTFGKGSVQKVFPMARGDGIKLTISRYYTPSGRSIQANGILPDVLVTGSSNKSLREQDLVGHLPGDDETNDGYARGESISGDDIINRALVRLKIASSPALKPKPIIAVKVPVIIKKPAVKK